MSVKSGPLNTDVQAREALDALLLGLARRDFEMLLDAAARLADLHRAGYRMRVMADPNAVVAKPVKIRSQFESSCRSCGAHVAIDAECIWLRGTPGVQCVSCGGAGA